MKPSALLAPVLLAFCVALPVSIAGINLGLGLLSALLIASAFSGENISWKDAWSPALGALILYCAASLTSSMRGLTPLTSLRTFPRDLHKVWTLAVFTLVLARHPSPKAYRALGAGFGFMALVGLFQSLTQRTGDYWMRAHGFVHPVTYGEQMALAFLGALCFYNRSEAETDSPGAKKSILVFLAVLGLSLILNQTRFALAGLAAGFGVLCWLYQPLRKWAAASAAAAVLVVIFWELMPTGRSLIGFIRHFQVWLPNGTLNPNLARFALWEVALQIFRDHPLTGAGPGNFNRLFQTYFHGKLDAEHVWGSAHNLYLHQLAERGLLGFASLAAVLTVLAVQAWRRARRNPSPWNLWPAGALAAFLVMCVTEVAFQNEQMATLLLFIWAWGRANSRAPTASAQKFV